MLLTVPETLAILAGIMIIQHTFNYNQVTMEMVQNYNAENEKSGTILITYEALLSLALKLEQLMDWCARSVALAYFSMDWSFYEHILRVMKADIF